MKNHGVKIAPPSPTDFRVGALPFEEVNPSGDWSDYIPKGERQKFRYFDSMACVSFSALNVVETQLHFLLRNDKLSQKHVDFLQDFMEGDEVNLSDRFTAKMSGTTRTGNYLWAVANSLRNDGAVPEKDWAAGENFSWDTYYKNIPPALSNKAKEFNKYFDISYEWTLLGDNDANADNRYRHIGEHLKHAPIQVATHLTDSWKSGNVKGTACEPVQHAYEVFNTKDDHYHILDHYTPYIKEIDANYCMLWAMKIVVTPKEAPEYYVAAGREWYVEPRIGRTRTLANLNYRTSPGVKWFPSNKVGTLPAGTEIEVVENVGRVGNYQWLKIKL